MPVVTVNKDGNSSTREDYVWFSQDILGMDSVTKSEREEMSTECELREIVA